MPVDFHEEMPYAPRRNDGQACLACVLAFLLSLGFQLTHKGPCHGGGGLTRHSPYVQVRLGGLPLWRLPGTRGKAVCTVLPPCVLRARARRPAGARAVLWATQGGLRLELGAVMGPSSPMALYRLGCAFGPQRLGAVLTRSGLPLPVYGLAAETPPPCLTTKASLPPVGSGRGLWHRGYPEEASAAAWPQAYRTCQRAASPPDPASRVRGSLPDGCDRTTSRLRALCPGAHCGHGLRPAITTLPTELAARAAPVRQALRTPCHTLWYRVRQRKGVRVLARGQR